MEYEEHGLGFGPSSNTGFPTDWLGPVLPVKCSRALVTASVKWEQLPQSWPSKVGQELRGCWAEDLELGPALGSVAGSRCPPLERKESWCLPCSE